MRPPPGTHTPQPARGTLESCLISGTDGLHEVWCHPDDTAELLKGVTVNGVRCQVEVVDRLAYADTLRFIEIRQGAAAERTGGPNSSLDTAAREHTLTVAQAA